MSAEQLIAAVKARDAAKVSTMLEEDPSLVTCRNPQGESPVMVAVYYGAKDILQQLLEWGAELDPFEAAAVGDLERLTNLLRVQPSVLERRSFDGFTMLALSAYFGRTECVRFLLSKGADVNARSTGLQNDPLHAAAAGNHAEIGALLVEAGANVNSPDGQGYTPLHLAAGNGNLELSRLLLERGAEVNPRSQKSTTPLGEALAKGHTEVAGLLRSRGATE